MEKTIVLLGTMDTKGVEFGYVKEKIIEQGCRVIVIDAGILGRPLLQSDITREQVAQAAGRRIEDVASLKEEGEATELMAKGAAKSVHKLYQSGKLDGILSLGGSMGTSLATTVMRALPIGVPKVMVSTVAAKDVRPYLGTKDITMIPSIVDIVGLNRISKRMLATAAGAIVGMVRGDPGPLPRDKPIIGISNRGNLMPCVLAVREILEEKGYEVVIFHAVGSGGETLEEWVEQGLIDGVFDLVVGEVTEHLFGGILDAGPNRLEAAGRKGIPQLIAPGDTQWISLNVLQGIPRHLKGRKPWVHNPAAVSVRANKDEMAAVGKAIAEKLNKAIGPTAVIIPKRGFTTRDKEGEDFHHPEADLALVEALRKHLDPRISFVKVDAHINDKLFAERAAILLDELMRKPVSSRTASESSSGE